MSDERFERWNDNSCKVKDNQEGILLNWEDVVNKLNKQQDIIGEQKNAIDKMVTDYKKLEEENEQLKEENEQLRKQVESSETTSNATGNYNAFLESKITTLEQENEQLRLELETHKHPLWSTREAEKKVSKLSDSLADEIKKNGVLNEEVNQLRIENMRLKKAEKINMEYAEQIVEENQKLRIAKNDLRIENERLKSRNNYNLEDCLLEIVELKEEKEQLKKN